MVNLARTVLFGAATRPSLERVVRATATGERLTWRAASRYVAGRHIDDAVRVGADLAARGIGASVDLFGEMVSDHAVAQRTTRDYVDLAGRIAELPNSVWLSIDLSHLGLDISADFCRSQLDQVVAALPPGRRLQVGAEDSSRTDRVMDVVLGATREGAPVMATVQANLRRSQADVSRLADAGVPVRLVKGAFIEPPELALPWGEATDVAYIRLAHQLHERGAEVTLATHDRVIRESLATSFGSVACELLLGVRNQDAGELLDRGHTVRVYVPYGEDWFRYFMRRLAEAQGA